MISSAACQFVDGHAVTIRAIHCGDERMEGQFVHNLSNLTKHYRFLGGVKELSLFEVKRLCAVDGVRSMAFVATIDEDGHEVEIGVSRYVEGSKDGACEMAVTVADQWQHKGLGRLLADRLIEYARSKGVKYLYSVELADNSAMRALAGELGMSVRPDPEAPQQVICSLAL